MKQIIRFFLPLTILLLLVNISFAQHWQDSTVAVPESIFPIGGINFGLGDFHDSVNSLKEAGFNMCYEREGTFGHIANIKSMTKGLHGYLSMQSLTDYIGAYNSQYFPGSERRFFLTSNDKDIYAEHETANNWGHKIGSKNGNNEWVVRDTMGIAGNTNYILDSLEVDPNSLQAQLGSYIVWPQTDSAYCDFIFYIDTIGKISSTWNTPRYSVEYYLKDDHGSVTTFFDTITINKQLAFLQAPNRDQIEHKHIIKFPDKIAERNASLTENYYARIRHVLPIHVGSFQAQTLEVKVRSFHNSNIFIRGLRIRSHLAEQVLTGQKDSILTTIFQAIHDSLTSNNVDTVTPFITAGGETQTPSFRVYSYIDDTCFKKIKKHVIMFLTADGPYIHFPWYRSIYEDQTDNIPPPLQAECIAAYINYNGIPPVPRDCIPDSIYNVHGFTMFGAAILPSDSSGYAQYTETMQERMGWCSNFEASQAAFPPGRTAGKWFAMLPALLSTDNNGVDMSAGHAGAKLLDTIVARFKRGDCNAGSRTLYRIDEMFDSGQVRLSYRIPFRCEMRCEGWSAIAFGAKGIYWNALGDDGGENIGITDIGLKHDRDFDSTSQCSGGFIPCPLELYDGFVIQKAGFPDSTLPIADTASVPVGWNKVFDGGSLRRGFVTGCHEVCVATSNCSTWGIGA